MSEHSNDAIRAAVRERYGALARQAKTASACCEPADTTQSEPSGCCDPAPSGSWSARLGYTEAELAATPDGADLGLGCGHPTALTELKEGEVVVDLGSGGGLDALIAARAVGPSGQVIGIDMTPEMLARARRNAVEADMAGWVEFRHGLIEALPVVDSSVDLVLSNCVINLSPDFRAVFAEAYRVLKPGGRLAISDILITRPLPPELAADPDAYCACIGGAALAEEFLAAIASAGFDDVRWTRVSAAPLVGSLLDEPRAKELIATLGLQRVREIADSVWSYSITAYKPSE